MTIADLQVGMEVRAIDNHYGITAKNEGWVGKVTYISQKNNTFCADTIKLNGKTSDFDEVYKRFYGLNPSHFERVDGETLLRVYRNNNNIQVYYRDKLIAEAKCSKDDTYEEEFGLNLALRRACKKLKDKHIITKTESVEDYL